MPASKSRINDQVLTLNARLNRPVKQFIDGKHSTGHFRVEFNNPGRGLRCQLEEQLGETGGVTIHESGLSTRDMITFLDGMLLATRMTPK